MTTPVPRLVVDELLEAASVKIGSTDFGDPWFLEPLGVLVDSLNAEAGLHPAGAEMTRRRLIGLLVDRLRLRRLQQDEPGILDVPVRVATEICGMPRTGSTLLQRLLAASPQVTSTVSWETTFPVPFPGEGADAPERKQRAKERMRAAAAMSPDFGAIHVGGWDEVDEDVVLVDRSFTSMSFESFYWIPSYGDWLRTADQSKAYDELRQWLQVLAWGDRDRQALPWVLKSPHHLTAVDTVLDTFPGCTIVMTHRSPERTVPSYASMVAALSSPYGDRLERRALGPYWSQRFADSLHVLEEARGRRPERFADVRYDALVADPVSEALRVLALLGVQVGPVDRLAVEAALAANRSEPRERHSYSLEDFGLDPARLARDFDTYAEVYL